MINKPGDITSFKEDSQVPILGEMLDTIFREAVSVKHVQTLPTTEDVAQNEIAIYDDDAGNTGIYAMSAQGNLLSLSGTPSGGIIMWSGAVSAIPTGWVICDGNNSTPNLTDKFVIHADDDSGGTNDVGDTGGAHSVTLTTAGIPAHIHNGYSRSSGSGGYAYALVNGRSDQGIDATSADNAQESIGGSGSHENRPAFYALAYIMKT